MIKIPATLNLWDWIIIVGTPLLLIDLCDSILRLDGISTVIVTIAYLVIFWRYIMDYLMARKLERMQVSTKSKVVIFILLCVLDFIFVQYLAHKESLRIFFLFFFIIANSIYVNYFYQSQPSSSNNEISNVSYPELYVPLREYIAKLYKTASNSSDVAKYGLMLPVIRFRIPDSSPLKTNYKILLNSDYALVYVASVFLWYLSRYASSKGYSNSIREIIKNGRSDFCRLYAITNSADASGRLSKEIAAELYEAIFSEIETVDTDIVQSTSSKLHETLAFILAKYILYFDLDNMYSSQYNDFYSIREYTEQWVNTYIPSAFDTIDELQGIWERNNLK